MLAECSWEYCGLGSKPSCRSARVKVVVASLISDHVVPDRFNRRAQSTPTCSAVFCTTGSSGSPKCSTSALINAACSLSTALLEGTRAWNITDGRPRPRLCSRSVDTAFISQSSSKCPRTVLTCCRGFRRFRMPWRRPRNCEAFPARVAACVTGAWCLWQASRSVVGALWCLARL